MEALAKNGTLVMLAGVHKHYFNGAAAVHALRNINLAIEPGELVTVHGETGQGKSTLLKLISLREPASEGEVTFAGTPVAGLSEPERARLRTKTIGCVFQSFKLLPVLTAQENVLLPLVLQQCLKRRAFEAAEEQAAELLARVGLATQVKDYPARLDAGQCQRVAIARALITRPRLVVADEPTSRLDSGGLRLVMQLFAASQREHGTAFVVSMRDRRHVARASRTLQIAGGRLLDRRAAPRYFSVPTQLSEPQR